MVGDGGLAPQIGELATIAQENLPITVVVFDDGGYGVLRNTQDRHVGRRSGVDLLTPDFAALASTFDIAYANASTPDEFADAYQRASAARTPAADPGGLHCTRPDARAIRPSRRSAHTKTMTMFANQPMSRHAVMNMEPEPAVDAATSGLISRSHLGIEPFALARPASLDDAAVGLANGAWAHAGGIDVAQRLRNGESTESMVPLGGLETLTEISLRDGALVHRGGGDPCPDRDRLAGACSSA